MTASWDYPRNIRGARVLTEVGLDHGLSLEQCLFKTGIDAAQLQHPTLEISAGQELQVVRNLLANLGNDLPLGFEAGSRFHPTTFGVWGLMILSSASVGTAIEMGMKYLKLSSYFARIELVKGADEWKLIARDDELPEDVRHFLIERDAASLLTLANDLLSMKLPLIKVCVNRPRPSYAEQLEHLLGMPAQFGDTENSVTVSAALIPVKLTQADQTMWRYFEGECRRLLSMQEPLGGIVARVRDRLLQTPGQIPDMQTVATEFNEAARTLRRRLQRAGTHFETLVEETRHRMAEDLLRRTNLSIVEVAERLGYSESSTFTRAFKRWTSQSPRDYRKACRPER